MESFLFGFCLIAVVWLIIWVERDSTQPTEYWWPFDLMGFVPKPPSVPETSWRHASRRLNRR